MIGDALNTYRKTQKTKIQPIVQTFFNMVSGYSSLEMYRDITILWGDIKRNMENGNFVVNRDLFELLMLNFLRGGYFERVMKGIGYMEEHGMYINKWMFKSEYLKFHIDLYRSLKGSNATCSVEWLKQHVVNRGESLLNVDPNRFCPQILRKFLNERNNASIVSHQCDSTRQARSLTLALNLVRL
ncbi:unnamed protein product [Camellia sinensis]